MVYAVTMNEDLVQTQPILIIPPRPALPARVRTRKRVNMPLWGFMLTLFGAQAVGGVATIIGIVALALTFGSN